jgi:hypothetical protein
MTEAASDIVLQSVMTFPDIGNGPRMMHNQSMRQIIAFGLLCALCTSNAGADMPSELAEGARNLGFRSDEIAGVDREPAVWIVERESSARSLTVAALAKLSASPDAILNDLRSQNGLLRSKAIQQVGRFSAPPLKADVAEYRLPAGDLEALSECEVGDCKFRLRAIGIEKFGEIDWAAPDARERADELARERLLDFVRSYQESGPEALKAPFADKEEKLSPGQGFDTLLGEIQWALEVSKALRVHLRDYPRSTLDGADDLILWNIRDYGYPPVTGVVHAVIYDPPGNIPVVALKNLYSSHYFHARLQLIFLFADPDDPKQAYLGYTDRMLFEEEVGSIKRRILEAGVVKDVAARLKLLRQAVE